jgi:predicted DNA-binding transcriptional regulator YafY
MKFKPQFRRLLFIDRKIREGRYPNCTSLGAEWEVSAKTIQRDIDYLKYDLDAPIEYDSAKHGYHYTESSYKMPAINISESDLFSVCIAERALKQFENTPLYDKLTKIFDRIEQSLPSKVSADPAWIENRIFFSPEAATMVDSDVWETIAGALRENRSISISHTSPGKTKVTKRVVDPYHLVNFKGEWYLSSMCHLRESVRTFAVSRMKKVEMLKEEFEMPDDFTKEKMFGDTFGIIWSADIHDVKIKFPPSAAPYIAERVWHPDQKIKTAKDGSLTLEFKTNHLNEVKDWILSWGPNAQVKSPPVLIDKIKASLSATMKQY